MKLRVDEILVAYEAIATELNKDFPGRVGYRLARIGSKLEPVKRDFDKARTELIKKLGEPTPEDLSKIKIKPENAEKYKEEISALLAVEEEVDTFTLDLQDLENLQLSGNFFVALEKFIKEA